MERVWTVTGCATQEPYGCSTGSGASKAPNLNTPDGRVVGGEIGKMFACTGRRQ